MAFGYFVHSMAPWSDNRFKTRQFSSLQVSELVPVVASAPITARIIDEIKAQQNKKKRKKRARIKKHVTSKLAIFFPGNRKKANKSNAGTSVFKSIQSTKTLGEEHDHPWLKRVLNPDPVKRRAWARRQSLNRMTPEFWRKLEMSAGSFREPSSSVLAAKQLVDYAVREASIPNATLLAFHLKKIC